MSEHIALDDITQRLIATLHRKGNYSFFQRINGDDKCSYWRKYGKCIEFPADIIENYNFYFGVNPVTMKVTDEDRKKYPNIPADRISTFVGPKNSTIAALNCVYAEFDGKDWTRPSGEDVERIFQALRANPDKASANDATLRLEALGKAKEAIYATDPAFYKAQALQHIQSLTTQPSVLVDSGGGYQGYFLFADTFVIANDADRERAISLQKRWVAFTEGDPSVHDIRRILRVPGSKNCKKRYAPNYPTISYVKVDFDIRYTFEQLEALLPPEEPKPVRQTTTPAYSVNGEGSIIDMFNATHGIADVLLAHGYTWAGKDRMNRPGSEDSKGVVIYADENESYHHSGGDPLHNGYRMKPFNVVCKLDYNDNAKAAIKALTKDSPKAPEHAPDKKLISVADYCAQINDDEPLDKGATVILDGESVRIDAYVGIRNGVPTYMIEGGNLAPATNLSVAVSEEKTYNSKTAKWQDYIEALQSLNYNVSMNDLDDTIEVNGAKLSDGIKAEILMRMHDIGLTNGDLVKNSYTALSHQKRYNPVTDYLNSLQWDGKDWIAEFERFVWDKHQKIRYNDGSIMPVFGAWLRRWGVGAVAKALLRGHVRGQNVVLVLAGPQNIGKSTIARFLCPMNDEYFIESHITPDSNEHIRYLATKLCWEVAELGATTRKADRELLKSFLTRQDCTFRTPYAHHPVTKPSLCSFIGTINPENGFLNDPTGNRRFLPVEIIKIDHDYIRKIDGEQLWAQFVALYRRGESWRLLPEETTAADSIRLQHETEDGYAGFISKFYDIDSTQSDWIETTSDIVYQLSLNGVQGANVTNCGLALKRLGLTSSRETTGLKRTVWRGARRNDYGDMNRR